MPTQSGQRSLQDLINETPDLVDYLYNETQVPHPSRYSRLNAYIPPEFTNWRDEQRAWRETAVMFDQSHHMPELFLSGPDAFRLLENVGINSLANLTLDRAKQLVGCTPRGHVIGDSVLYRLEEDEFELVSGMPLLNWVQFQAETGDYDVKIIRDAPTPYNPLQRRIKYRFQLDGPSSGAILAAASEGETPEIPFFCTAVVKIRGCEVLVLRHGMAGHQGVELSGPYDQGETVRGALLQAGVDHGLLRGGTVTYFSATLESGWLTQPCPGIFTGDELCAYRDWLPADGWEGNQHFAGSFYSTNVEDYYATPWDLGYGKILKFDHNFIGRAALEGQLDKPHRTKVTLVWDDQDAIKIYQSELGEGPRYKWFEPPLASYGHPQADEVRNLSGDLIGVSAIAGYSYNDRIMASLAMIDQRHAEIGNEVIVTWGEPNGGSRKPEVERHEQLNIRARVFPAPYAESVQYLKHAAVGPTAS